MNTSPDNFDVRKGTEIKFTVWEQDGHSATFVLKLPAGYTCAQVEMIRAKWREKLEATYGIELEPTQ